MRKLSVLALVLGLAACRSSGGGNGDDTVTPDSPTGGGDDVKIQDIQNDAMTSGTPVAIKGVVVTAIDKFGGKVGDFWVQEPEGGEYSGIHVFGAKTDQVSPLTVGDVVDIAGAEKDEFQYMDFDPGYGITELKPVSGGEMVITKTPETMVLQPHVVDALTIGQMNDYMARDAEWEKWEGVLIQVNNVLATSGDDYVSSKCPGTDCPDMTLSKFDITGDIVVESSLTAFPTAGIDRGDCFGSAVGVLDYFFDYELLPRSAADLVTGTGCPTEDTQALCTDNLDNDGNGFKDCGDNACILADSTCHPATTINAIQTASTPPMGGIELTDVRVMAISRNKKNMWVSTNLAAAANEGIYVYGTGADLTYTVGSKVNVTGTITEFNDNNGTGTLTELKALSITAGSAGGGTMTAPVVGVSPETLTSDSTGEPYESVMVTLPLVRVVATSVPCTNGATPPACNYGAVDAKAGSVTFKMDDDILANFQAGCYGTVTGFWTYMVYDNTWGFLPQTLSATATGCPN